MESPTLDKLLSELLSIGRETEWIEYKVGNSNESRIGQYLSALSNGAALHDKQYGYLIFGIEDETLAIVGTDFKPSTIKKGAQPLENWLSTMLKPRVSFKIFEFPYQGKDMVMFVVEAASERPIKFQSKAYVRVGSSMGDMDEYPNLEKKLWSKGRARSFELELAVEGVQLRDVENFLDINSYFSLLNIPLPESLEKKIQLFARERFVALHGDKVDITNLGALLFAKGLANFDQLQRKAIRVIVYESNDRTKTRLEQVGQFGYVVRFRGLVQWIMDQLPAVEVLEGGIRSASQMYPEEAIRELVANAIIHQDFFEPGTSVKVEIFSNRIEITNPGRPLIDVMRLLDEPPQSRNELLASFMRRVGICEERGSGIDKVVASCESHRLPAPKFEIKRNHLVATLFSLVDMTKMEKEDRVRSCYLHCCLLFVKNQAMTNESVRHRFQIERRNHSIASRIIKETVEQGIIRPRDPDSQSRKYASYVPFWA